MELLIEASLWQPQWAALLLHWQQQGHRWQLLLGKEAAAALDQTDAPWASSPPDGVLCPGALLAAWLDGDLLVDFHVDPSRQILISASTSLLTLAREQGLLTLGPVGADLPLTPEADLGAVLNRLLARRVTAPTLAEGHPLSGVVLRPLQAADEREIVRYCSDEALARYTLNIPHPYPPEGARDWLALSWRKAALGLGWSWAITLPEEQGAALLGVISLHWNGELAWWVGVPWQNRGLATRAARLVKAFAFDRLQLPVLTARHMPGNLASGRVMAKLGMRYCGRRELSGQPPCEVSYWQLERSQTLAAPLTRQLAPLLADERVVAAILQAGAEEDEPRRLALFLAQPEPEGGLAVEYLPEQESDGPLAVEYHDQEALAQAEPDQLYLYRGLLLKDHEEQGLAYLQQLASLQRQGPAPLTLAERRQRLGWLGTLARRASGENTQGEGVSRRYHQLWLLVELPALIDELAGRWHRGPDQTLSWLAQTDTELFAAYRAAITTQQPSDLQTVLRLLAVRFPESTLPFLDKGAQGGGQFVE